MLTTTPARRRSAALGLVGAALLLAPACAGPGTDSGDAAPTRTVDTVMGEVAVPEPEDIDSVVVLEGRRDTDVVLALDLPLVGYPSRDPADGYELRGPLADGLEAADAQGAQPLFLVDEINLEAIAQVAPDLIVSRSTELEPIMAELQAIAPVVPIGNQDETTWQADLLTVGAATGRTAEAEALIAEYDARVQEIRTRYAEQIATTSVVPFEYDDEGTDVGGGRLESMVLQDVGALPSEAFAQALDSGETVEFSFEQTRTAYDDADAILVFVTSAQMWASMGQDALWTSLPAVEQGQVVRGDRLTHDGGPLTALHVLDQVEQLYASV
ncbi:ABC transporter substrate-binding protein [Pseudokineococcus sp. 1T1Z-3]|uniref:ABC transporter substrate-binding protein n=1 Tax=Pseudokineococcus sp. 1T1Z-3 TaxID=3132745 RepID=UPI0030A54152